jgi:hypothetical protein
MSDIKERGGFHFYYRGVSPVRTSFQEKVFMTVVTLALVVGLPAALTAIFWGIARLGSTWGGGH